VESSSDHNVVSRLQCQYSTSNHQTITFQQVVRFSPYNVNLFNLALQRQPFQPLLTASTLSTLSYNVNRFNLAFQPCPSTSTLSTSSANLALQRQPFHSYLQRQLFRPYLQRQPFQQVARLVLDYTNPFNKQSPVLPPYNASPFNKRPNLCRRLVSRRLPSIWRLSY
jgi:hypothetical protein